MKSEIKKNIQKTNSEEKETRTQINDLEQKEERNIQLEQNEETRIQKKNKEMLRNLWDNFKPSNTQIIEVPEGEEEEQEIENLFENIMKENFPIWQRKQASRKCRKLRESQRSWTQGRTHQGTSYLHYPRLKIRIES